VSTKPTQVTVSGKVTTNLPVPFTISKTANATDLDLISSNLIPDPKSTINYVQWFGEVVNKGTRPACFVEVTVNFKSADGQVVQAMHAYAYGDSYKIASLNDNVLCVSPGKTGVFYSNDLPAAAVDVSLIGVAEVQLRSNVYPEAAPHPANPGLSNLALVKDPEKGDGYWVVMGAMTATQTIYNVAVYAHHRDENGLVLDRSFGGHSDTLLAGTTWDFKTFYYQGTRPASYLLTYDYLLGAKPTASALVLDPSGKATLAADAQKAFRDAQQRIQERAARNDGVPR
jgi:hypothetical protein